MRLRNLNLIAQNRFDMKSFIRNLLNVDNNILSSIENLYAIN